MVMPPFDNPAASLCIIKPCDETLLRDESATVGSETLVRAFSGFRRPTLRFSLGTLNMEI